MNIEYKDTLFSLIKIDPNRYNLYLRDDEDTINEDELDLVMEIHKEEDKWVGLTYYESYIDETPKKTVMQYIEKYY